MGHWATANKEKATRSHRRSRLLEPAPRLRVRALRRPPRARALPCEGLHRCGHSFRWGRRICICASPERRQAAGFQSDVRLRDDTKAPGPSALATAGLELRGAGAHGAFFVPNLHRANIYTRMNHVNVHIAACAAIDSRCSSRSPLAHKRSQPASAHCLLVPALPGRHLEQYSMNATCAICDYLPPPILNMLSREPPLLNQYKLRFSTAA